jgi:GNAT superfamily N-acetyltransferase
MKSITSKFAKAKTQGFLRTLEVQFNRFVPPWVFRYSKGDIYDFDVESLKSLRPKNGVSDDLTIRCLDESASEEDRLALREFTWNSVPLETTSNDIGYAVYDANETGKLLAGVWAAKESFFENNLGVKFTFTEKQSWLYCAFVHADARGRGIYKSLISYAAADLQDRGFSQLLGIVQPWNRISRIMHEKQSRGIIGRMSATRVGSLVWISSAGNLDVDRTLITNPAANPAVVRISRECWKRRNARKTSAAGSSVFGRSNATT